MRLFRGLESADRPARIPRASSNRGDRVGALGVVSGFRLDALGGPFRELAREIEGTVVTPASAVYQRGKVSVDSRFDGAQCHVVGHHSFKGKSDYVDVPLPNAGINTLLAGLEASQASTTLGGAALFFDAYGGAINRVHPAATAFVHRDALFSIQYFSSWVGNGLADLQWIRNLYAAMRPYVSGFAYQNYIDPDLKHWQHAYYGANLRRLTDIKRKHDPHSFFHFAQGIPTRPTS
jgi:FAD/FMN-containing dehydrogenase